MKYAMRTVAMIALGAVLSVTVPHASAADEAKAKQGYVCPPCGCGSDHKTFDEPGNCPACGMALMKKSDQRTVGIVLFDGVELLDFAGPGETFAAAMHSGFSVTTVSDDGVPVMSQGFLMVDPEHSIKTVPDLDILVIPGGNVGNVMDVEKMMAWIKEASEKAEVVLTVCNGALVAAKHGFLDGKDATTHHSAFASLRRLAPTARVHEDRRWCDNGKFVTAGGVSAGIDGALYVIKRLAGAEEANRVARYMEYRWIDSPSGRDNPSVAAND